MSIQLSPREMEVLALAWQCMESQPKIDMKKLASLTGYTPGSASVTFGNIKRKIKLLGENLAAAGPATPKNGGSKIQTPKTSGKRSKAAADHDDPQPTPSKRSKKAEPKKARNDDDDDDEDFNFPGGGIKKEELNDLATSADDFFAQAARAAGYPEPEN